MRTPLPWLSTLKAAELHKLAISLGTPCSGTKSVQVHGIEHALSSLRASRVVADGIGRKGPARISVVSIDMGIRNLAYSAWTSELEPSSDPGAERRVLRYQKPVLTAWKKIDISSNSAGVSANAAPAETEDNGGKQKSKIKSRVVKESFEPIDYADRAYDFVQGMLAQHNPSHVLIERQRFRTGGNSAVQEWTIRVGVFEGMLYAVLRSLAAKSGQYQDLVIEPVLPVRVNRYWLENLTQSKGDVGDKAESKKRAGEVKQMKISLVKDLLARSHDDGNDPMFRVDASLAPMVSIFLKKGIKASKTTNRVVKSKSKNGEEVEISKLDDLADCFLQGLAWMQWHNNRLRLDALEDEALPLVT